MGIQVQVLKQEGKNNFFLSVLEDDPNTEKLVMHSYVTVTLYDFDLYIIDAQYRSKADFALIEEALYQLAKKIKAPNVYLSFSNKDSTLNVINDIKAFVIAHLGYKFETSEFNITESCTVMCYRKEVQIDPIFKDAIIKERMAGIDYPNNIPEGYRMLSKHDLDYLKTASMSYLINESTYVFKFREEELRLKDYGAIFPSNKEKIVFDDQFFLWVDPKESTSKSLLNPVIKINRFTHKIECKDIIFARCLCYGIYVKK